MRNAIRRMRIGEYGIKRLRIADCGLEKAYSEGLEGRRHDSEFRRKTERKEYFFLLAPDSSFFWLNSGLAPVGAQAAVHLFAVRHPDQTK